MRWLMRFFQRNRPPERNIPIMLDARDPIYEQTLSHATEIERHVQSLGYPVDVYADRRRALDLQAHVITRQEPDADVH